MAQSRQSYGSAAAGPSRLPRYIVSAPRASSSSSSNDVHSPRTASNFRRSNGGPRKSSAFDDFDAPMYCNDMAAYIAEQLSNKSTSKRKDDYRIADLPGDGWRGTPRKTEATQLADVSVQTAPEDEEMEDVASIEDEEGIIIGIGETQDDIDFARTRKTKEAAEAFLRQVKGNDDDEESMEQERELEKQALSLFGAVEDDVGVGAESDTAESVVRPEVAAQIAGMLRDQKQISKKPLIEVVDSSEAESSDDGEGMIHQGGYGAASEEEEEEEELEEGEEMQGEDESDGVIIEDSEDDESDIEADVNRLKGKTSSKELVERQQTSEDELEDDKGEVEVDDSEEESIAHSSMSEKSAGDGERYINQTAISMLPSHVGISEAYESDQDDEDEKMSTYDSYANNIDIYQDEQGRRDTRGDDSDDAIELLDSDDEEAPPETIVSTQVPFADAEIVGDSSYEDDVGISANLFEQEQAPMDASFWTAEPGDATMMEGLVPEDSSTAPVVEEAMEVPELEVEEVLSRAQSVIPPPAEDLQSSMTSGAHLLSLKSEINTTSPSESRQDSTLVLPGTPQRATSIEGPSRAEEDGLAYDAADLLDIKKVVNDAMNAQGGVVEASLGSSLVSDVDSLPNKNAIEPGTQEMILEEQQGHVEEHPEAQADAVVEAADQDYCDEHLEEGPGSDAETEPLEDTSMEEMALADPEAILNDEVDYAQFANIGNDQDVAGEKDEAIAVETRVVEKDVYVEEANDVGIITPRRSGRARTESRRQKSLSPLISRHAPLSATTKLAKEEQMPENHTTVTDSIDFDAEVLKGQDGADAEPKETEIAVIESADDGVETPEQVVKEPRDADDSANEIADVEGEEEIVTPEARNITTQQSPRSATPEAQRELTEYSTFDSQLDTFDSILSTKQDDEDTSQIAVAGSTTEPGSTRGRRRQREGSSERRSSSPIITKRSLRSATPSSTAPFSYDSFMTVSSGDAASSFDEQAARLDTGKVDEFQLAAKDKPKRSRGRPSKVRLSQETKAEEPIPTISKRSLRSSTPRAISETPSDMSVTASGKKKRRSPRKSNPGGDLADFVPETVIEEAGEDEETSTRPNKRARTREPEEELVQIDNVETIDDDDVLDTSILEGEDSLMEVDELEIAAPQEVEVIEEQPKPKKTPRTPRRSGPRKSVDPSYRVTKVEQTGSDGEEEIVDKKRKRAEQAREKKEADREKRRLEREEKRVIKAMEIKEAKEAENEAAGLSRKRKVSEDAKTFRPEKDAEANEMEEEEEETRKPMTRRRSRRTASQTPGS